MALDEVESGWMVGRAGKLAKWSAILPFISGLQRAPSNFLRSIIFSARSVLRLEVLTVHLDSH